MKSTGLLVVYLGVQLTGARVFNGAVAELSKTKRADRDDNRASEVEEPDFASPDEFIDLKNPLEMSAKETDLSKDLEKEDIEVAGLTNEEQKTLGRLLKVMTSVSAPADFDKPRRNHALLLKFITKTMIQLLSRFSNQTEQTTSVKREFQILKEKFADLTGDLKETRMILGKVQNSHVAQSPDSKLTNVIDANSKSLRVMKKELGDIGAIDKRLNEMRVELDKRLSGEGARSEQCRLLDQQIAMMFELWHMMHRSPESGGVKVSSATQSSTGWGGIASRAIDGIKNPRFRDLSCSHTRAERHPWLLLKLGGLSRVTGVEFTNRGDCCHQRLSNFSIQVFRNKPMSPNSSGELCNHFTGMVGQAASELIECNSPVIVRYVKITLEGDNRKTPLTVCEAVVKGESLNKLQGRPTLQNSVASSVSLSDNANDGDKTTCSETLARSDGSDPWWQVDMGRDILVRKVFIWNRKDDKRTSLKNLTITVHETFPSVCTEVTSHICMAYPGNIGQGRMVTFACKRPIRGRYLKIQTARNNAEATLTLCEISVNDPIIF